MLEIAIESDTALMFERPFAYSRKENEDKRITIK